MVIEPSPTVNQFFLFYLFDLKIVFYRNRIQYNTGGCPAAFRNEFYIQLALPISSEIMDRFRCSRCLNNCIKVPHMMRLFAGGATTPWW